MFQLVLLTIAQLMIGFSVFYALLIVLTRVSQQEYQQRPVAAIMGLVLMVSLMALQVCHYLFIDSNIEFANTPSYVSLLAVVAPAFYFFSKPILMADDAFKPIQLLHFSPVIGLYLLPYGIGFILAFLIGAGYLIWLVRAITALAQHRQNFKHELSVLTAVFVLALSAAVLGLLKIWLNDELYFALHAIAIGTAFFLVAIALSHSPGLSKQVTEAAKQTYAVSTLSKFNVATKVKELLLLMDNEHLYQERDLGLQSVAKKLGMSGHQLSELVNTQLGMSFSNFLRVQRVEAAKAMLINEPSSSVLSIGMAVGFASQSNFYEAFNKVTGSTPGKYRKSTD